MKLGNNHIHNQSCLFLTRKYNFGNDLISFIEANNLSFNSIRSSI